MGGDIGSREKEELRGRKRGEGDGEGEGNFNLEIPKCEFLDIVMLLSSKQARKRTPLERHEEIEK